MEVFLFIFLSILCFWRYADKTRFAAYLPITLTAIFIRFLEQFIIISWMQIMIVHNGDIMHMWIPIFADASVWPISGYLYIQYMPNRHRFRYTVKWVLLLILYLHLLMWMDVFHMKPGWKLPYLTPVTVGAFFAMVYAVWRWLYPAALERRTAHES